MSRSIELGDFLGRTIVDCQHDAENVVRFRFSDGGELEVWAEVGSLRLPFLYVEEIEPGK